MSLHADLQTLQEQRQREIELLRHRVYTLGDALEGGPRHLVQEHPYLATGGAAVVGFLAAQVAPAFLRKFINRPTPAAAAPSAGHPAPAAGEVAGHAKPPAPAPASALAAVLPLLVNLAEQFLQPPPEAHPATLRVADAGAVAGTMFPVSFVLPNPET